MPTPQIRVNLDIELPTGSIELTVYGPDTETALAAALAGVACAENALAGRTHTSQ